MRDHGKPTQSPPLDEDALQRVKQFIEEGIPFNRTLGVAVEDIRPGYVLLRIPFDQGLIGDPFRPALHGGVTSMIADTAGGAACFTLMASGQDRFSTIDLRVDYLRPGRPEDVLCTARVERMGNRVALTRMEIFSGSLETEPIALATAAYSVCRSD